MRHRTKKHKRKYTKRIQKTKNKLKFSKYKGKKSKKNKKTNKTKKNSKGGTKPTRERKPPTRYTDVFATSSTIKKVKKAKPKKAKPKKGKPKKTKPKKQRKPNFYFWYKRLREERKTKRDALRNIIRLQNEAKEKKLDRIEVYPSRSYDYDELQPGVKEEKPHYIFNLKNNVQDYINLYKNAFPIGELKKIRKDEFKDILFDNILKDYENANIYFSPEEQALLHLHIEKKIEELQNEMFNNEDINRTPEELEYIKKLYTDIKDEDEEDEDEDEDEDEEDEDDEDEEDEEEDSSSEDDDDDVKLVLQQPPDEE